MPTKCDRAVGALLGLAAGDALGTTLEFCRRDSRPPVTDVVGGGPSRLKPGEWTDDTGMALCLADSLLARGELDPADLMQRFCRWWRDGENSCTGECFDIGGTTSAALAHFERTGDSMAGSADPRSAGNGSLMRLAPVPIFWHCDAEAAERAAREQSATTHGAHAAVDACAFFASLVVEAITGGEKPNVLRPRAWRGDKDVMRIASGAWRTKTRDQIRSSGYVIHTLEAALWCVGGAETFRDAVLTAANLGDDADTTAAVAGQLAGAIWGVGGIPHEWLDRLAWRDRIENTANALYERGIGASSRSRAS